MVFHTLRTSHRVSKFLSWSSELNLGRIDRTYDPHKAFLEQLVDPCHTTELHQSNPITSGNQKCSTLEDVLNPALISQEEGDDSSLP